MVKNEADVFKENPNTTPNLFVTFFPTMAPGQTKPLIQSRISYRAGRGR